MTNDTYKILIKDLVLEMSIGVLDHEKKKKQTVVFNIIAEAVRPKYWQDDDIRQVVSYADIINIIKNICAEDHTELLETLAEKIITEIFADKRIIMVEFEAIKKDIFPDADVGIKVLRYNNKL